MADSTPIEGDKLIDVESLVRSRQELEQVVVLIQKTQAGFKAVAAEQMKMNGASGGSSTSDGLTAHNERVKKSNQLTEASIRLKLEEQKTRKALTDAVKAEDSAYQALANQYGIALKKAKDLAAQYGVHDERTKAATAASNVFNNKLKEIDFSLGNHGRNVGNYNDKLREVSKTLKGFGGLGIILSNALGIDPMIFDGIREAGRAVRDLQHAKEIETLTTEENVGAKKSEIAINEELAISENATLPVIGLVVVGIAAASYAVWEYVKSLAASKEAIDSLSVLQKKYFDSIMAFSKADRKISEQQRETNLQTLVDTGKITEFEKKRRDLNYKYDLERRISAGEEEIEVKKLVATLTAAHYSEATILEKAQELRDTYDNKQVTAGKQLRADLAAVDREENAKELKVIDKQGKTKIKIVKENNKELLDFQNDRNEANLNYDDKEVEFEKKKNADILAADRWVADQIKTWQDEDAKEAEKLRLKKIDDEIKTQEMITEAASQAIDERLKREEDSLHLQTQILGTEAQVQATLAAAGKKNSLDQILKDQAKAIDQEKIMQRKAHREQEALDLANLFIKAEEAYMKAGSNPMQAASKAMASVLLAKGIAAGIAGAFATGVEGLNGKGTETSDSNLALLSKGESVITAKATRQNKGLATAMNMGKVDEYFKQNYMPDSTLFKTSEQEINGMLIKTFTEEIRDLKKIIKDKREVVVYRNAQHELVNEINENGVKRTIITKEYPIVQRRPN